MKAKVKTSEIIKGLKTCVNATDARDDIRSCVMFSATDGCMKISASNSLYSISCTCNAEVDEEGFAVVEGKTVYSFVSKASDNCSFNSTDVALVIKGCGKATIPNIGREIPMVESASGKHVTCDSVAFREAVNKIKYAISEDQARIILTGAHFVTDGSFATITALDGFRLAQTVFPCDGDCIDIVIPSRTLSDVCDSITSGSLDIFANASHMTFAYGDYYFNSILLSGNYVDTKRIIPSDFKAKALANTADIKNMIELAMVASGKNNLVKMSFAHDRMHFSSNDTSAFEGDIDTMYDGDDLEIAFNLKYLSHAISHITTEKCVIRLNSNVNPAVITPHSNETVPDIHLLLPVRTFS